MKRLRPILLSALLALTALGQGAHAQQTALEPAAWLVYKSRFVEANGRVVDNGNGGISHSESQGYGLLLAYMAGNRSDFEQIWSFTRTELLLRDDGLAVWKWDPASEPHVADTNNASDGDLLIAYGLALAGAAWDRADYIAAARKMAEALRDKAIVEANGRTILMPAVTGFDAASRADGPVVNLSYWIFEALPVMAVLAPSEKWQKLSDDGLALLKEARFGPRQLPPEWLSLKDRPKPAQGFDPEFGYNAIRIPIYLARAGITDATLLTPMRNGLKGPDGAPAVFDLETDSAKTSLADPGYRIAIDLLSCVIDGTKLPLSARQFAPSFYYPATLQLLGLAYIGEKHRACL